MSPVLNKKVGISVTQIYKLAQCGQSIATNKSVNQHMIQKFM